MRRTLAPLAAAIVAIVALVCCNPRSPSMNLSEQPAVFSTVGAETQDELLHGIIREGEPSDFVYLALGQPARVEQTGATTKWIYSRPVLALNLDQLPAQEVTFKNGRIVAIDYGDPRGKFLTSTARVNSP